MNKPITILHQEFMKALIDLINNSELPAFVLAQIMEDTRQELIQLAEEQYKEDKTAWEESQKEANNETEEETE